ncbi:glycoside hydrolase family 3 C-terminal domain-containing protein [Microbacterium sp.]|uniref:glycoside hydrolase family 3 C-terminal domain-containing protein n=1 Tax=Microbacterium sp. TaxID=51671 RepID=UPI0028124B35|nr:glycoside hydrolase family 3 C-terminal domain-containing protein [Microbacterium sp.]
MSDPNPTADVVAALSPLEKASLLSGQNTWQTRAVPRIGVRSLFMSDGPHGVRKQIGSADHLGLNESQPSTCFPTAATIANSWDPELGERIGAALGREAALLGVDVLLGPGLNIKRSPLCGRNFEYFSEDPYLTGRLGGSFVRGIQSAGVAACPKHFAVNSQETRRMTSNSVVDETTLREIYLTAFEMVVRDAAPLSIMSSYNLINGTYAHENAHLLQDILRDEWGFDGAVVTDWGGGNDPVAAIAAGGTIEMPSPGFDSVRQILASPAVDQAALDARVGEAVRLAERISPVATNGDIFTEHDALAQHAAEQSVVLLKNDEGLLPLSPGTKVAVIGEFARTPRYQGAGSSLVKPTRLHTAMGALGDSDLDVIAFEPGFAHGAPPAPELMARAAEAARRAEVVLLYLGLDEIAESEGKDRDHLDLAPAQVRLLEELSAANQNIVVVLSVGSAVAMPWLQHCRAVLHGYLGGQAGAPAMVRAITGQVNPSGRLAESYPLDLADTPTADRFPETRRDALYFEGPFIGYRYYATAQRPVLFPFGYGLSYTRFEYSDLRVQVDAATFTVRNVGDVAGADVPQLYIGPAAEAAAALLRPALELKGFRKVHLEPGESATVTIPFDRYTFRSFSAADERWLTIAGAYEVWIGRNAEDRPLHGTVVIAGDEAPAPAAVLGIPAYAEARVHDVRPADFRSLLGRDIEPPRLTPARKTLGLNSPLSDLRHAPGLLGRLIYSQYFQRSFRRAEAKGAPDLNLLFQYGMPFRAIAKMSGGLADMAMVDRILMIVNGCVARGLVGLVSAFFANRRRHAATDREFTALATGAGSPLTEGDKQ